MLNYISAANIITVYVDPIMYASRPTAGYSTLNGPAALVQKLKSDKGQARQQLLREVPTLRVPAGTTALGPAVSECALIYR